jgi:hypothetical protein
VQQIKTTANDKAINEFFQGYENDTLKEYGNMLFSLISILKETDTLTKEFEKDTFSKLMSLHKLISEIKPTGIRPEYSLN